MTQFKNLSELQKYVENNIAEVLYNNMDLERILADAVVESVIKNVYEVYEPEFYKRREEYGLDDPRNYQISGIKIVGRNILLHFENLTTGNDNMQGEFISDIIEEGSDSAWSKTGEWSNPRPFMEKASEYLKQNPKGLLDAVKSGLRQKGFQVK